MDFKNGSPEPFLFTLNFIEGASQNIDWVFNFGKIKGINK